MNEQIYSFSFNTLDDTAAIPLFDAIRGGQIVAVEKAVRARSANTVANSTLDVNVAGSEKLNNIVPGSTPGTVYQWICDHLGGPSATKPIKFNKGDLVTLDLDHAGAGTLSGVIHVHVVYDRA